MKKIDEFMAAWERNFTRMGTDYAQDARDAALEVYGDESELGGEMPAPWPGMGVEWKRNDGRSYSISNPRVYNDGEVYYDVPGFGSVPAESILAIYDGRRCIWRRKEGA